MMYCNDYFWGSQQDFRLQTLITLQGNLTFPVSSFDEMVGCLLKKIKNKNKKRIKRMRLKIQAL